MPKKHTPAYASTKPSYVHPSLQSSRGSASSAPSEPQSVNQRIQQLRREQAPRATLEQRDELTSVVSRTVPPELRRILHIPEVNAPKPKAGARQRRLLGGARPPPGPAAPSSWLQTSRHAPAYMRFGQGRPAKDHNTPSFSALARVTDTELKRLPPPRSLVHHCLRTFATHWEELIEYEQHYVSSLPVALKEALLSYLTIYGATSCLDLKSFKILFQNEEGAGTVGWDETQLLDLTGLLNEHFAISDIGKCLRRSTTVIPDMDDLQLDDSKGKEKHRAPSPVADSWEEEVDEPSTPQPILAAKLQTPHFVNLSRLSLAHPGHGASWPDLLRISPQLNKITHLSLAYWPRPSTTPNATTTSMVSNHTSVSLGGSHFYSDLDDDWHEAANILRRFSTNTYSLRWLDLEGCNWLKALSWGLSILQLQSRRIQFRSDDAEQPNEWDDVRNHSSPGPDWNDAWRRVTYIRVFQGWIPSDKHSLQDMPAGVIGLQLLSWLRDNKNKQDVRGFLKGPEVGMHAIGAWVDKEKTARSVAGEIQLCRKMAKGEYCKVDYGWGDTTASR